MQLFWPRGTGPLVSVLLPTRGRPAWLVECISSLWSTSLGKQIDFLLRIDDDDTETITLANHLAEQVPVKTIIGPHGNGYHDCHLWVNELSAIATGDWLLLWNDDARMTTQNWDAILAHSTIDPPWHGHPDVAVMSCFTLDRPGCNEFVFLRRKVVDILGHFSISVHNDNYIWSLLTMVDSARLIPIYIKHLSGEAKDLTRQRSEEAYKTSIHTLISLPALRTRLEDAGKLLNYIQLQKGING